MSNSTYTLDSKHQFRVDNTSGYTRAELAICNIVLNERMAAFLDLDGQDAWIETLKVISERTLRDFDDGKLT